MSRIATILILTSWFVIPTGMLIYACRLHARQEQHVVVSAISTKAKVTDRHDDKPAARSQNIAAPVEVILPNPPSKPSSASLQPAVAAQRGRVIPTMPHVLAQLQQRPASRPVDPKQKVRDEYLAAQRNGTLAAFFEKYRVRKFCTGPNCQRK